ncbi:50S ribosomal protein L13 [Candidatus Kaiserbacteria bacterium RIFCSPHIGHO2_01_FULL_53_29]|uniref:50S ribosomal protein L13 n=1 Tax=Candidatus Kaiserbacteria bacterium RIFCSPHIGHO2_01_FULL_53_29 TaxID=1798480 RepID=A0A1F6CWI3_9BACT|nr:MAG: 50S ribosomal protein L13 [Candidatus Kaiserbacteria bacterium RIFCSPHIGHO2_01_FULL_53_29]
MDIKDTSKETYSIDAAGRTLGRVASEAAKALMGKTRPDYTPNKNSDVKVTVQNAAKLYIRERKRVQKIYTTYSGYPGGQKRESLASLNARKPGEALRRAVARMLPRNTMHTARMKNLAVTE